MKKPKVLIDWEAAGPPMVCYNCDHRSGDHCVEYDDVPPEDFRETAGACAKWLQTIPF